MQPDNPSSDQVADLKEALADLREIGQKARDMPSEARRVNRNRINYLDLCIAAAQEGREQDF